MIVAAETQSSLSRETLTDSVPSVSPWLSDELKKRRVLVVTNMYPDAQNPDFGTFVQEQVEGLRARGLTVDVLVVGGKRRKLSYVSVTMI